MSDSTRLVPDCRVSLAGRPLALEDDARLTRVCVDLDVELFGQCSLTFIDPRLALINGDQFKSGSAIKVELGFAAGLRAVFEGEVVALEPQFLHDLPPSLRVVCQEVLHRLALSQMTRAFNDVDEAQIVAQIAREHGLRGEGPSGTTEHVLQSNVTDAVFLRKLAQKNGQHLRIEGKKLVLGPPPRRSDIKIGPDGGLRKMKVRIRDNRQVAEVTTHGWDPKAKREIFSSAKPQGQIGEGAKQHGKGSLALAGEDSLPADTATAEAMAKGRLRKLAESFVVADGEMIGDGRVVPGASLLLDGMGAVDGTYRVERAAHEFSKHGYLVKFHAVRTAKKKPPKAPAPGKVKKPAAVGSQPQGDRVARQKGAQEQPARTQGEGEQIEIEVLDVMGKPRPGFFFQLQQAGSPVVAGQTDERGLIKLKLPKPGPWKLTFPDIDNQEKP